MLDDALLCIVCARAPRSSMHMHLTRAKVALHAVSLSPTHLSSAASGSAFCSSCVAFYPVDFVLVPTRLHVACSYSPELTNEKVWCPIRTSEAQERKRSEQCIDGAAKFCQGAINLFCIMALVEIASINVFMTSVVESTLCFCLCSCCFQFCKHLVQVKRVTIKMFQSKNKMPEVTRKLTRV
jgi:hypothetical protein